MTDASIGFGAFISPLHPPGEDPTLQLWRDMELVEWIDQLGLAEAWIGEHHSGGWGTIGSPEVFIAAAAERTRHIRLGTGVASLPYHHPFMVAERIVQLDHMTRGRVLLGVGAGSMPSDAHMLGIEPSEQRRMTAESVEAVVHLLRSDEPLTMRTDWFTLRDARLQLRPYGADGIEVAVSSAASPYSMRLAGRHGLSPLSFAAPRPGGAPPDLRAQWVYAEEAAAAHGRTVNRADWRLVVTVYVGETKQQALDDVRAGAEAWMRGYFGDLVGLPVDSLGVPAGRAAEYLAETGAAIIGSADDVAEAITELYDTSGGFGKVLVTGSDWSSRENAKRSFELLARYVAPRFRGSTRGIDRSRTWVMANRSQFVGKAVSAFQRAFTDSGVPQPQLPTLAAEPEPVPATSAARCPVAPNYPFAPPNRLEADPHWQRLREEEPLSRVTLPYGGEAWLATRYEDVRLVLSDRRFSRKAAVREDAPRFFPTPPPPDTVLSLDPPQHTSIRRLVARTFTPRRAESLRPRVAELAEDLLAEMARVGPPADLVGAFALPLSVTVICELLGVPPEDQPTFSKWADAALSTTAHTASEVRESHQLLHDYLAELVAKRRYQPTDDLLGALMSARGEAGEVSEAEITRLAQAILVTGYESTASQVPNFVYTLLHRPRLLARLRGNPDLVPAAVEELLRFVPLGAVDGFPRVATEDVEVGGVMVRAGEAVLPSLGSANRDQGVFADPESLDLERSPNAHVAFGYGPHHCLGAHLARVELQVALTALLRRFPKIRIAVPEAELEWKSGLVVRGLHTMPVAW